MSNDEAKERAKNYMSLKGALEPKQIKCYCGHTSYCDCSPIDEAKQEENEIIDISDHDGIGNAVDNLNNEPPQETTIEEANWKVIGTKNDTFYNGAKWQKKRMYSEEEVYHILVEHTAFLFQGGKSTLSEWFEQFKKK
jgi:hypothetical protein